MSLLGWIKGLFSPTLKRDVSRLQPASGREDAATELVEVSGGPWKEGHRRKALRDPRLLPKPRPAVRTGFLGSGKRKKHMSMDEATRLFAGTLRTRNRNLRDLKTDEEQLTRYGLPIWRTEEDLACSLGITVKQLRFFSIHRERELVSHYVTFAVPKRSGGDRLIMAPKCRLKAIQRTLASQLIARLPVSDYAHGFRPRRSVRTNAEPHVGKSLVVHLDLQDFFPSVTFARVRGLLIAYGYSYPIAATLAVLMTEAERQPVEIDGRIYHVPVGLRNCVQGAPTSPGICNSLLLKLDRRLGGLARKFDFTYTRYADDLTFSGNGDHRQAHALRIRAAEIVRQEGFVVNAKKTRIIGKGRRQLVTGVVVNETLGLSRKDRRKLRAEAHRLSKSDGAIDAPPATFVGKLAYLSMLNPAQAAAIRQKLKR